MRGKRGRFVTVVGGLVLTIAVLAGPAAAQEQSGAWDEESGCTLSTTVVLPESTHIWPNKYEPSGTGYPRGLWFDAELVCPAPPAQLLKRLHVTACAQRPLVGLAGQGVAWRTMPDTCAVDQFDAGPRVVQAGASARILGGSCEPGIPRWLGRPHRVVTWGAVRTRDNRLVQLGPVYSTPVSCSTPVDRGSGQPGQQLGMPPVQPGWESATYAAPR